MTNSFKTPQPSPSGVVLSLARALGIVSSIDDVVIVPLSEWQAMNDQLDNARRIIAARDERIAELNVWLDSHVPMVTR